MTTTIILVTHPDPVEYGGTDPGSYGCPGEYRGIRMALDRLDFQKGQWD